MENIDEAMQLISAVMELKELSLGDMFKLTGIPKQTLQKYLNGKLQKMPAERLNKVGEVLHIPINLLISPETLRNEMEHQDLRSLARMIVEGVYVLDKPKQDVTFDNFTYAMYKEAQGLTEEKKQQLLEMARFFRQELDKG